MFAKRSSSSGSSTKKESITSCDRKRSCAARAAPAFRASCSKCLEGKPATAADCSPSEGGPRASSTSRRDNAADRAQALARFFERCEILREAEPQHPLALLRYEERGAGNRCHLRVLEQRLRGFAIVAEVVGNFGEHVVRTLWYRRP